MAAGVFLLVVAVAGGLVSALTSGNFAAALAATLIAAFLFGPVRERAQRSADSRFGRDRERARRLLREAAEAALATLDVGELGARVVTRVRDALSAEGTALYARDADGWRRIAIDGAVPIGDPVPARRDHRRAARRRRRRCGRCAPTSWRSRSPPRRRGRAVAATLTRMRWWSRRAPAAGWATRTASSCPPWPPSWRSPWATPARTPTWPACATRRTSGAARSPGSRIWSRRRTAACCASWPRSRITRWSSARACARPSTWCAAWRAPTRPCCCAARPAAARRWWRARCTRPAGAAAGRSWWWTAARCRVAWSSRRCSGTSAAPSPARSATRPARSGPPTAGRSSSTSWASCR